MVLIDTNVLAYLLLEGDHTAAARELHRRDPDWLSEAFILVEFSNVLVRYHQTKALKLPVAAEFLRNATTLMGQGLTRLPHHEVLEVAVASGITAYDARFVALAQRVGQPLITEDARLRAAAPALTQSLEQALASR